MYSECQCGYPRCVGDKHCSLLTAHCCSLLRLRLLVLVLVLVQGHGVYQQLLALESTQLLGLGRHVGIALTDATIDKHILLAELIQFDTERALALPPSNQAAKQACVRVSATASATAIEVCCNQATHLLVCLASSLSRSHFLRLGILS